MVSPNRYEVPMSTLRINTRKTLSDLLNAKKIFKTKDNLCRDWRGLAHLCSVTITNQSNTPSDPTDFVLLKWQEQERATVGQFFEFLERLDRYDVIADTEEMIDKDVERYLHLKDSVGIRAVQEQRVVNFDELIITTDDVCRIERGLGPQIYDALVLFADEEWDGAKEIIDRLEEENFKLCLKDRDMVAGVTFEHKAIMTLIEKRCNRVIVLLSPKFVKSPWNEFFHLFAQSVQIERKERKVIPYIYKDFRSRDDIPVEFRFYKFLSNSIKKQWPEMFWHQLRNSVISPEYLARINQVQPNGIRLQELPNAVSHENRLALPSSGNSEVISSDNVQEESYQPSSEENSGISISGEINKITSHDSLKCNGDRDELNGKSKKVVLVSDIQQFLLGLKTKKFMPSKLKVWKKKVPKKCPVVA